MKNKLKLLVLVDLDGTCADMKWRHDLAGKEPNKKNWSKYKKWLTKIQSQKMILKDRSIPGMREMCILLKEHAVYLTARNEIYRKVTNQWLKKNKYPALKLYMRPRGNRLAAGAFKEQQILNILHSSKGFVHVVILDDDQKKDIALAAKKNGWTILKALSGS